MEAHWHKRIVPAGPNTLRRYREDPPDLTIRPGVDSRGHRRHWILEIHLVDRAREIGGFYAELLTVA